MVDKYLFSRLWWLWLPVLALIVQLFLERIIAPSTLSAELSENGLYEILQFFIIAAAFVIALLTVIKADLKAVPFMGLWMGLAVFGTFYVAGEEISWGQHVLGWGTPDGWMSVNDQGETNLHNTSHWLDQKPRQILELGVVIGGLIVPYLNRYKPTFLSQKFVTMYPPAILGVCAGILLFLKFIALVDDNIDAVLFVRISELQETYIYYFVLLYMVVMRKRLCGGMTKSNVAA